MLERIRSRRAASLEACRHQNSEMLPGDIMAKNGSDTIALSQTGSGDGDLLIGQETWPQSSRSEPALQQALSPGSVPPGIPGAF
ncbi:MAG: hypothetical protein AAFR90_02255 [Pseudomonadota bacterium]